MSPSNDRTGIVATLRVALSDIKLAHSVFALPFAVLASFWARDPSSPWSRFTLQLALVVVCMVLARTWAMLFNRIADREQDAANPRTAGRAVASGRLPVTRAWAVALASAVGFVGACTLFWALLGNPWPVLLSVPVLAWIAFYSLTKRFTWWCHVFLGGALAASPVAAALAVRPDAVADVPAVWWIAGMVVAWVAGFDVIYALQDAEYDRGVGLRSVPARFGWRRAAWFSRALHVLALAGLVMAGISEPRLGVLWWVGLVPIAGLLVAEHAVLARRGEAGLHTAFFTLNGVVSIALGVVGVADTLL